MASLGYMKSISKESKAKPRMTTDQLANQPNRKSESHDLPWGLRWTREQTLNMESQGEGWGRGVVYAGLRPVSELSVAFQQKHILLGVLLMT